MPALIKRAHIEHTNQAAVTIQPVQPPPPPAPPPSVFNDSQSKPEEDLPPVPSYEDPAVLLAEAQAHVEAMLNQAQLQVTTIHENAHQLGWQAGYTEGHNEAIQAVEKKLTELTQTLQKTVDSAVEERNRFLRRSQDEISQLVVAIARKVIGQELSLNPQVVTEIVAQAIKEAAISGACRIRVNPADYSLLSPAWETIPSMQPSDRKWELVSDNKVSRGGCLIEANGGILDAQIDSQLGQVQHSFERLHS